MKYIAFYGAWATSILSLILFGALMAKLISNTFNHVYYDTLEALVISFIATPLVLLVAVLCAWIVCDMKKRMKDL